MNVYYLICRTLVPHILIIPMALICLCQPAQGTTDAFSSSAPNWLGEVVWTQDILTCNAIAGSMTTNYFYTDNYSNTASVRFKYKANKGYSGGSFMSYFKFYVGGVYLGDYDTGEFFFWDQGDSPKCLTDFQLHTDISPNSIYLS